MMRQYSLVNVLDNGLVEEFLITPHFFNDKLTGVFFEYFIDGSLAYSRDLKAESERAAEKLVRREVEDMAPELFRD